MTQALAIRLHSFGAPDVMKLEAVEVPTPGPGEVQVKQTAIGFNYIDVYQRSGYYPLPAGTGLGHEAAGEIVAIGSGVSDLKIGDRIATINAGIGAYASLRNIPADKAVKLPDGISDETAAAVIFKGLTAQYLLRHTYKVGPGDRVLIHAAAGGVGLILAQWARSLGAFVAGTAGSDYKCELARKAGCNVAVNYRKEGWAEELLHLSDGKKFNVVYDSVAKDTFMTSLDLAAPFGYVVLFGAASGPAPAIEPELLNKKGCLFLTRPSIFPHNADVTRLRANADDLFAAIKAGHVSATIGARFALKDAAKAHETAQSRATTGAILLLP
jgi:NADPH2:quinone reductase